MAESIENSQQSTKRSEVLKCPKCGAEIDYLDNWESGAMRYRLHPDGGYEGQDFCADGKTNEFECPECQKVLFTNETDALKFLKGEGGE